jgi:predicted ferric reductase
MKKEIKLVMIILITIVFHLLFLNIITKFKNNETSYYTDIIIYIGCLLSILLVPYYLFFIRHRSGTVEPIESHSISYGNTNDNTYIDYDLSKSFVKSEGELAELEKKAQMSSIARNRFISVYYIINKDESIVIHYSLYSSTLKDNVNIGLGVTCDRIKAINHLAKELAFDAR